MIAAVSMVKDEADIVAETVGHMARNVDLVIVADNGSTDGTRDILDEIAQDLPLEVLDDPEVGYYQARKMTALAHRAWGHGAAWVIPFDADEVWFGLQGLRETIEGFPDEALIAEATLFDHVPTALDEPGPPVTSIGWRRTEAAPLRKVAVRARHELRIHQGNHSASYTAVHHPLTVTGQLEIHHFPYRSAEQFIRKARNGAAAYAATNLPQSAGQHWREYGATLEGSGPEALESHFRRWFHSEDPEADGLVYDPCLLQS